MRWDAFATACPEIADIARRRFTDDEVIVLGTLRGDGSPRISPNELDLVAGHLFLGMMWRSRKALDLLRDPRVAVHSCPQGRMNPDGDVKLYGRAVPIDDPGLRRAYREALFRRIAWAPEEPRYHLISVDVTSAGYARFGEDPRVLAWDDERGLRQLPVPGP